MCGICGYYGNKKQLNINILKKMNNLIVHRGPDDDGFYVSDESGLAMRRLSILDLEYGKQPIYNENRSICTVFNGEIYNFKELKKQLIENGHKFYTNCDTEVIVHLYEEYGKDFVQHLSGMFSIAIWDLEKKSLVLARDRLGIKPLFYSMIDDCLIFGSEIKCLLASGLISKEVDHQAIDAFFAYTYIPAPLTIYREIKKLEPGHIIVANKDGINVEQYWDVDFSSQNFTKKELDWKIMFEQSIFNAIKSHLLSDVPVGAFLSGGVDSSLIVSMMAEITSHKVNTFTLGFEEQSRSLIDERKFAKLLADQLNINYNEYLISPKFEDIVSEIVKAFDEPFADDSVVPSFYISKLTRKNVKVALSGLGGDELFGGYHRYYGLYISRLYDYMPNFIHKYLILPLVNQIPEPKNASDKINHLKRFLKYSDLSLESRYLGYVSTLDNIDRKKLYTKETSEKINFQETNEIILSRFKQCKSNNVIDKMFYTDLKTYLPDDILALSDRISMWHSLELRVPFLDHKLVEESAKLPMKFKINIFGMKRLLKKIAADWIPRAIVNHRKQGFESPMAGWLRNEIFDYTNKVLSRANIEEIGILDYAYVKQKIDAHYSGKEKNNKIIFSIIMFVLWYQNNQV